jgi:tRNA (cytidine/uridine-2'-O-)-methyltransferase
VRNHFLGNMRFPMSLWRLGAFALARTPLNQMSMSLSTGLSAAMDIILVQPQIPSNTGAIIRLCANTGAQLHLVKPISFELDDTRLKRAGLDYHEWQDLKVHETLEEAIAAIGAPRDRVFAVTTKATKFVGNVQLQSNDVFVFGSETAGLTPAQRALFAPEQTMRLPMLPKQRSLNLANAVSAVVFEAWRQQGYAGGV